MLESQTDLKYFKWEIIWFIGIYSGSTIGNVLHKSNQSEVSKSESGTHTLLGKETKRKIEITKRKIQKTKKISK